MFLVELHGGSAEDILAYCRYMDASHVSLGRRGEQAVANHLVRRGYVLRETNYLKKWGEIDLILEKDGVVHFVEVKTVSGGVSRKVPRETWRPEENVHAGKLKKLFRTIETWLLERAWEGPWQLDVAAVRMEPEQRRGSIKVIENVIKDT